MSTDGNAFDLTRREVSASNRTSAQTTARQLIDLRGLGSTETTKQPEIVVVRIPDVTPVRRGEPILPPSSSHSGATIPFSRAAPRGDLSNEQPRAPAPPPGPLAAEIGPSSGIVGPIQAKAGSGTPAAPIPAPAPASAVDVHAAEPATWWHSVDNLANDRQIADIARRILAQFPSIAPCTLMFASTDPSLSTNRAAARIAAALSRLTGCRSLLIDANWETNIAPLKQSDRETSGLTEVLAENRPWKPLVVPTQDQLLHVLPCGVAEVPMRRIGPETLLALVNDCQREFTYVCVNGGSVKQLITRRLSTCCDGSFLFVGLNQTTRKDAQSAMKLLGENHARVMGAIVFDSLPPA
jgi:hypothetical protein